jgi:hypothetical protein
MIWQIGGIYKCAVPVKTSHLFGTSINSSYSDVHESVYCIIHVYIRIFSFHLLAMITLMDESIGNITKALHQRGIVDDALIIFQSDVSTLIIIMMAFMY